MDYQKILVALDFAPEGSSPVFDRALVLAKTAKADLKLFHCLRQATPAELNDRVGTLAEMDQSRTLKILREQRQNTIEHVQAWLLTFAKKAAEQQVSADVQVAVGKRGPEICDLAKIWGADLIMLGTPHRGSLADFLAGSISSYVLHNARRSILFVHER